jgi:hypothetical protein
MKLISCISLLSLLLSPLLFAKNFPTDKWSQLMHYEEENTVISSTFYITKDKNIHNEYYDFINLLKSESIGLNIACKYPARYTVLKKYLELPIHDLQKCGELTKFVSSFQKKNLSLAMTTEYFGAPSSLFGHLMLVFHNKNKPELNSSTVNFSAQTTKNEGFFNYIYKGMSGKFNGIFSRIPLFKKLFEYSKKEQRYTYYYNLNFSKSEIKLLLFLIYELRESRIKYFFLNQNCAFQIERLLDIVTGDNNTKNFLYTLPIDVVSKYKYRIGKATFSAPDIAIANQLFLELSQKNKKIVKEVSQESSSQIKVFEFETEKVTETLHYYYSYLFRKEKNPPLNFQKINSLSYTASNPQDRIEHLDPLKRSPPRKVSMFAANQGYYSISYRPVLLERLDFQYRSLHESEFSVFTPTIGYKRNHVFLEEFKILNLSLLTNYNSITQNFSWKGGIGLNRINNEEKLLLNTTMGTGQTFSFSNYLSISWFGLAGFDTSLAKMHPFVTPELNLWGYLSENVKYLLKGNYKVSKISSSKFLTFNLAYKISSFYTLTGEFENFNNSNKFGANFSYYY